MNNAKNERKITERIVYFSPSMCWLVQKSRQTL